MPQRLAQWRARVEMFRRAGGITPAGADVAVALAKRLGVDGRLDSSCQTIASDAGYSVSTVQRALVAMRECGLAYWVRRLIRAGWRAAQTSNKYALTLGDPPALPALHCDGQSARQAISGRFSHLRSRSDEVRKRLGNDDAEAPSPSYGSDEWARWNAARQIAALAVG